MDDWGHKPSRDTSPSHPVSNLTLLALIYAVKYSLGEATGQIPYGKAYQSNYVGIRHYSDSPFSTDGMRGAFAPRPVRAF
jgi:hypothetical protein